MKTKIAIVGVLLIGVGSLYSFSQTSINQTPTAGAQKSQPQDTKLTEKFIAMIKTKTIEAERGALQQKPDIARMFMEEHKRDLASYRMKIQRYGSFLAIAIQRGKEDDEAINNLDLTINLGKLNEIVLQRGRLPDNKGILGYSV